MKREIPSSCHWLAARFKELERQTSPDGSEQWFGWVAKEKVSRTPVGIFETTIVNGDAFIAYTVFKSLWGTGFAVEGSRAMINYINNNFRPKRFVIEMDTRNRSSFKVAEKLGFDFVKVTNNAGFIKDFVSHEFQFQKLV